MSEELDKLADEGNPIEATPGEDLAAGENITSSPAPSSETPATAPETTTPSVIPTETFNQEFKEFCESVEHDVYTVYEWLKRKLSGND